MLGRSRGGGIKRCSGKCQGVVGIKGVVGVKGWWVSRGRGLGVGVMRVKGSVVGSRSGRGLGWGLGVKGIKW